MNGPTQDDKHGSCSGRENMHTVETLASSSRVCILECGTLHKNKRKFDKQKPELEGTVGRFLGLYVNGSYELLKPQHPCSLTALLCLYRKRNPRALLNSGQV